MNSSILYIIPTIDTENPQTLIREGVISENLIDPEVNGQKWGASRLSEIFLRENIKAVFFLASSEKKLFGESAYKKLAVYLDKKGHEVAVHSHPEWLHSADKRHMWQLSFEEQKDALSEMTEDLFRWTGKMPTSHRAGAYGLDINTLSVLSQIGLRVDSSMFAEHPNCKVSWAYNQVMKKDGILEVPVTGFYRVDRFKLGPMNFQLRKNFIKTDLNSCSLSELLWFVDQALRSGIQVMNLFMHSYSLFDVSRLPDVVPDVNALNRLECFLAKAKRLDRVEFVTLQEYQKIFERHPVSVDCNEKVAEQYRDFRLIHIFRKIFGV